MVRRVELILHNEAPATAHVVSNEVDVEATDADLRLVDLNVEPQRLAEHVRVLPQPGSEVQRLRAARSRVGRFSRACRAVPGRPCRRLTTIVASLGQATALIGSTTFAG